MDVARKLLILAREAGYQLELNNVLIEPALPPEFDCSGTLDDFMARLTKADAYFEQLALKARNEGKVLRYIASIERGQSLKGEKPEKCPIKCEVKIKAISADDPMFKIKDGENALAFYSRYYQPKPLVLRGYGAGTEVTAAGIFADLMRTLGWKLGA